MVENVGVEPKGAEFPSSRISIAEFLPQHWQMYRAMKMKSVLIEPIAFGDQETELKRYMGRSEGEWIGIISGKLPDGTKGESVHLFAQEGAILAGMLSAEVKKQNGKAVKEAWIYHLYVEPDMREQGIARKLCLEMIERLREKGVGKVELSVVATQEAAIKLYESLGFGWVDTVDVKRGDKIYPKFELELELK